MFLLLFFISFFCFSAYSQINPVVTPSYTTLAVGASSLDVEYNYNFTSFADYQLQLFVNNEPIENITSSTQSCSGYANDMKFCTITVNFNSIAANYVGSNLTACVIVNNVTSSNSTVAVVVPPPVIQSAQPIYLFQNTFLLYGENLGQGCNDINIKPFFISGYVHAYSSNGTILEITISSTITSNYLGQYVNLSVFCSGVWSNVLVANKLEYPPVDTTSSVVCGGTQKVTVQNRNPISCFIYIRGNGMERQGNISSFVINVDSGTTSDFTQVDNYTIQFYYAAPAVTSSIIANLTVVEVNSQQNIINSPLAMTILKNTEPKKKHLGKPLFLGLIIGVPAAVIIILIIIVVLLKRRKNSHYQRIG